MAGQVLINIMKSENALHTVAPNRYHTDYTIIIL